MQILGDLRDLLLIMNNHQVGAKVKSLIHSSRWSAALNSWALLHYETIIVLLSLKMWFIYLFSLFLRLSDATALHLPTLLVFNQPHRPNLHRINTTLSPCHLQHLYGLRRGASIIASAYEGGGLSQNFFKAPRSRWVLQCDGRVEARPWMLSQQI